MWLDVLVHKDICVRVIKVVCVRCRVSGDEPRYDERSDVPLSSKRDFEGRLFRAGGGKQGGVGELLCERLEGRLVVAQDGVGHDASPPHLHAML